MSPAPPPDKIAVRYYRRDDQGVVEWVEDTVGTALTEDHSRRSPHCASKVLMYVKIPVPEAAAVIGIKPVVH